jgi:hypothetical protein
VRWGLEQRLSFIEFRLFWDGAINRADLMNYFGVSAPQASADLARYDSVAPSNLSYDSSAKAFVPAKSFRARLQPIDAESFLGDAASYAAGLIDRDHLWLRHLPPIGVVPSVHRRLPAETLRDVLGAIRSRLALQIEYQSFSRAEPTRRWITPHAIAFDGFRWHARALCHENSDFRDFVLARVRRVEDAKPTAIDGAVDEEWRRLVTLRLAANPQLPSEHRRAIEFDFGMSHGALAVEMRVCEAYYFERLHGLDLDPTIVPAQRQQIVLVNREEVDAARLAAKRASQIAVGRLGLAAPSTRPTRSRS